MKDSILVQECIPVYLPTMSELYDLAHKAKLKLEEKNGVFKIKHAFYFPGRLFLISIGVLFIIIQLIPYIEDENQFTILMMLALFTIGHFLSVLLSNLRNYLYIQKGELEFKAGKEQGSFIIDNDLKIESRSGENYHGKTYGIGTRVYAIEIHIEYREKSFSNIFDLKNDTIYNHKILSFDMPLEHKRDAIRLKDLIIEKIWGHKKEVIRKK